jgi:Na+/melibiose symporter-like transporter
LKGGLGFGGAISGWLLGAYGYVANVPQTARALEGIRLTSSLYASIPFFLGVVCLFGYKITKALNIQITDELAARRLRVESDAAMLLTAVPPSVAAAEVQ